jgi:predicted DNA-binding protein
MSSNVNQIKVSLPDPLYDFLNSKASKFGLTLSSYVKNLIINDVKDMEYPVYQASKKTEDSYKKALQERDQATEIQNVEDYFKTL